MIQTTLSTRNADTRFASLTTEQQAPEPKGQIAGANRFKNNTGTGREREQQQQQLSNEVFFSPPSAGVKFDSLADIQISSAAEMKDYNRKQHHKFNPTSRSPPAHIT